MTRQPDRVVNGRVAVPARLFPAALGLAAVAISLTCGGRQRHYPHMPPWTPQAPVEPVGLVMEVRDGPRASAVGPPRTVAAGAPLSGADYDGLIASLAPLPEIPADEPSLAAASIPPPRPGRTLDLSLGAAEAAAPEATPGSLEIVRKAPAGDVDLAAGVSITFNQPMVALAAHGQVPDGEAPARISPRPSGSWRWIGTQTVVFEPSEPFAKSTRYTVTVPATTAAVSGASLGEAVTWSFVTPERVVVDSLPGRGEITGRTPVVYALFDAPVDAAAIIEGIRFEGGGRSIAARAATADEVAGDERVAAKVRVYDLLGAGDRGVAFVPAEPLPTDTSIAATLPRSPPAYPDQERSARETELRFRTYGPLGVEESHCWTEACPPGDAWWLRFSNIMDPAAFDAGDVTITPALPGAKILMYDAYVYIEGPSRAGTTYTVTLPAGLRDRFGQRIDEPVAREFRVGEAPQRLIGPSGMVVVRPERGRAALSVFSIHHDELEVTVRRVTTDHWGAFLAYTEHAAGLDDPGDLPGDEVLSRKIEVAGEPGELVETRIDLTDALIDGYGQLTVRVEPAGSSRASQRVDSWVQVTDLGLDAYVDRTELVAWATRLSDGAPVPDVAVRVIPAGGSGTTDDRGVASVDLSDHDGELRYLLVAARGADTALLPDGANYWDGYGMWRKQPATPALRWYAMDDRGVYKPGETAHIKGWVRRFDPGEGGDISGIGGAATEIAFELIDPVGARIGEGTAPLSASGGFDFEVSLPAGTNTGYASVRMRAGEGDDVAGREHTHAIQVEEFRRPDYEVNVELGPGPYVVGDTAAFTASARYYTGGAMPDVATSWLLTSTPGTYAPPNRGDYTFGVQPTWSSHGGGYAPPRNAEHVATTDDAGESRVEVDLVSADAPRPMTLTALVNVVDVSGQTWSAEATTIVHPSALYVGLKPAANLVAAGDDIAVDGVVVDIDGNPVDGVVAMRAVRLDWTYEDGAYREVEADEQLCSERAESAPVTCELPARRAGEYRVTATVVDGAGRRNESQISVWVLGDDAAPGRSMDNQHMVIVPDKPSYSVGDTATLMVRAPFYPAEGLLTVRRSGVVHVEAFRAESATHTLHIPITAEHVPNVHVAVDLVGRPDRPTRASAFHYLPVSADDRRLSVTIEPDAAEHAPGDTATVGVRIRDAAGQPVPGAEVVVVAVDEAVLALSDYQLIDPTDVFYAPRGDDTRAAHSRDYVQLPAPENLSASVVDRDADGLADWRDISEDTVMGDYALDESTSYDVAKAKPRERFATKAGEVAQQTVVTTPPGAAGKARVTGNFAGGGNMRRSVATRTNFAALAAFVPDVVTDAAGEATVSIELPDSLTRYRIMAVAAAGERRFGAGESTVTARLPLMVRATPPRFLNHGDVFELPVVIHNAEGVDVTVALAVRASNLDVGATPGRRVTVPARDRVEVRFAAATERTGEAHIQIVAASADHADAAELAVPVRTPATEEVFATYGTVGASAIAQAVERPGDVIADFGGLEITASSTRLQALTDAFLYLVRYPYGCAEQVASRVLAITALRDVLTAFDVADMPSSTELEEVVNRDIARLQSMQSWNGAFALWPDAAHSLFASVHAAHALARARDAGYYVPASMLDASRDFLADVDWALEDERDNESVRAYVLYVRALYGDHDVDAARRLARDLDGESIDASAWLLSVLATEPSATKEVDAIVQRLHDRVIETAGSAHFAMAYDDLGEVFASDRRTDALALEGLLAARPDSDLAPKLVEGLLGHRVRGRWQSTQENVFVLIALRRYFDTQEALVPDFTARVWLGQALGAEHRFAGRSTDRVRWNVPMASVPDGRTDVTLARDGSGAMYYRIALRYATAGAGPPIERGFAVTRTFEPVSDADRVDRAADGTWTIGLGSMVRVRIRLATPAPRQHVALVAPLAAGLEPVNPSLVPSRWWADQRQGHTDQSWRYAREWFEHQNLRDERAEAFTSRMWAGTYEYSFVARATTPGTFTAGAARAEQMYSPEVFGRSAVDAIVIE